ncbi:MAG: protein-disulfide reductase DsbD domain-containing protein [Planctomycetota bacterium]
MKNITEWLRQWAGAGRGFKRAGCVAVAGVLLWGSMEVDAGVGFPKRDGHVEAQLISETPSAAAGQSLTVGLRLAMDEGWHTYWQNPGESGQPTAIAWQLPEGFVAHPIEWPAPTYFEVAGLASFAYEGEIVLPMRIEVPADFDQPRVTLRATADWLVCREVCEPGEVMLTLTVPVVDKDAAEAVRPDPRWAELFAWAAARQPEELEASRIAAAFENDRYRLELNSVSALPPDHDDAEVRFFPRDARTLAMSAPQEVASASGSETLAITLEPHPNYPAAERLQGVLVIRFKRGDVFSVYQIDQPIRGVAGRG